MCVLISDLHCECAGVREPVQKVGSLLWGTGQGLSQQGTVSATATHVSIILPLDFRPSSLLTPVNFRVPVDLKHMKAPMFAVLTIKQRKNGQHELLGLLFMKT